MAGLEVVRSLNDAGIRTRAPIEVAAWTNEEGSRFVPTLMGSGVYAGVFGLDYALAQKDVDGVSVGDALRAIGYAGEARPHAVGAYFEAHIEQGPVLEDTSTTIGVVQGALGQRWFDVAITGQDSHAGPTPMETRKDALLAASRLVLEVNRIANTSPGLCARHGRPHAGQAEFAQRRAGRSAHDRGPAQREGRDASARWCEELKQAHRGDTARMPRRRSRSKEVVYFPPSEFAPALVDSVRRAAQALGHSHRDIVSGAAHDAVYMARIAPTAMVFVPCEGGISHNEIENARAEDIAAGCNVLAAAVLERAGTA